MILFFLIKDDENLGKAKELAANFSNTLKASDWMMFIDLNNCASSVCAIHGLGTEYFKSQILRNMSALKADNGW